MQLIEIADIISNFPRVCKGLFALFCKTLPDELIIVWVAFKRAASAQISLCARRLVCVAGCSFRENTNMNAAAERKRPERKQPQDMKRKIPTGAAHEIITGLFFCIRTQREKEKCLGKAFKIFLGVAAGPFSFCGPKMNFSSRGVELKVEGSAFRSRAPLRNALGWTLQAHFSSWEGTAENKRPKGCRKLTGKMLALNHNKVNDDRRLLAPPMAPKCPTQTQFDLCWYGSLASANRSKISSTTTKLVFATLIFFYCNHNQFLEGNVTKIIINVLKIKIKSLSQYYSPSIII